MDLVREIKRAIETGKVYFGLDQARKSLGNKNAKLFVVAKNCPDPYFLKESVDNVPTIIFQGTSSELGSVCGKMFDVSIITIIDPGESALIKKE